MSVNNILLINTYDIYGGAEKVAMDLHRSYLGLGLDSKMLVGNKRSDLGSIYEIPQTGWHRFWHSLDRQLGNSQIKGAYRMHTLIKIIKAPYFEIARRTGTEDYHYPESRRKIGKFQHNADVIHLHNLHKEYFDLRILPALSKRKPVLITMHDEYLYTAYSDENDQ